ncbi:hypothetical protein PVK06_001859 [Gossypium arboreum]|uniref:Uncharacterized protein n=1 Tax=Gossypium arboreum TaxID=29729 RepID=A0ABR0R337_GOSAR|nr:hypothetical protein PVK06_001859 [Gossypium arboreum]
MKEDFEVLEGDIQKTIINGIPSIKFSDRIRQILIQDMNNTVIFKLLGHNIGFSILQNRIYSLWKPSSTFHLMDTENRYFLAKFENKIDCEWGVEELGKEKLAIVTSGNGEISRVTDGGSSDSRLGISNNDGYSIFRFFPRSSQWVEGPILVAASNETNDGLDPCSHTMITFKEIECTSNID